MIITEQSNICHEYKIISPRFSKQSGGVSIVYRNGACVPNTGLVTVDIAADFIWFAPNYEKNEETKKKY